MRVSEPVPGKQWLTAARMYSFNLNGVSMKPLLLAALLVLDLMGDALAQKNPASLLRDRRGSYTGHIGVIRPMA